MALIMVDAPTDVVANLIAAMPGAAVLRPSRRRSRPPAVIVTLGEGANQIDVNGPPVVSPDVEPLPEDRYCDVIVWDADEAGVDRAVFAYLCDNLDGEIILSDDEDRTYRPAKK